jgi:small-conductance mechanosensitive channel
MRKIASALCRLSGVLIVAGITVLGAAAFAESNPPPPAGMSQQQFDDLVRAVGQSVLKTLSEKGVAVGKPPPAVADTAETDDTTPSRVDEVANLVFKVPGILETGYPQIFANLSNLPARLDRSAAGGYTLWAFLSVLALALVAASLSEFAMNRITASVRARRIERYAADGHIADLAGLAALDGLAILTLFVTVHLALAMLFSNASKTALSALNMQQKVALLVLNFFLAWRLYLFVFRLFVRPEAAQVRIAPIGDRHATELMRLFALAVATIIISRAFVGILVTPGAIAAAILTNACIVPAIYLYVALRGRTGIDAWLVGLIDTGRPGRLKTALAHHWVWFAVPTILLLALVRAYGGLTNRLELPLATILTVNVFLGLLLAETLLAFVMRRKSQPLGDSAGTTGMTAPKAKHPLAQFIGRSVRVSLFVAAAAILVRTWTVDVFNLVEGANWSEFSHGWGSAAAIALLAFFAWEAVRFFTAHHGGTAPGVPGQEADSEEAQLSATRLQTLMPILRVGLGIAIGATAILMILTSLGVNITPLVAGASVVGLAISFGSQTLVRDIVSGVFYLADDAFRVGEYIDCGKAKGTVEGFTLRSIRLRHQNGQVHTIPFGQLGQITNFSRDWSTLKFNLRFARDTDLEKLRKVTKKVGLAMLEEPEFKDDFLSPLKMQGIAEIADNALVIRFKLTVKPMKPTYIQREAVKRLIVAIKAANIEFASATVAVQTVGSIDPSAAAAAAASLAATKVPAPAAP